MINISTIARKNGIPEADLVDFAISRDSKYNVEMVYGVACVEVWLITALLADFNDFQVEEDKIMAIADSMSPFDVGCEYDGVA